MFYAIAIFDSEQNLLGNVANDDGSTWITAEWEKAIDKKEELNSRYVHEGFFFSVESHYGIVS